MLKLPPAQLVSGPGLFLAILQNRRTQILFHTSCHLLRGYIKKKKRKDLVKTEEKIPKNMDFSFLTLNQCFTNQTALLGRVPY